VRARRRFNFLLKSGINLRHLQNGELASAREPRPEEETPWGASSRKYLTPK
jgi:hypothetical protein